jgi:hypothetical protein
MAAHAQPELHCLHHPLSLHHLCTTACTQPASCCTCCAPTAGQRFHSSSKPAHPAGQKCGQPGQPAVSLVKLRSNPYQSGCAGGDHGCSWPTKPSCGATPMHTIWLNSHNTCSVFLNVPPHASCRHFHNSQWVHTCVCTQRCDTREAPCALMLCMVVGPLGMQQPSRWKWSPEVWPSGAAAACTA